MAFKRSGRKLNIKPNVFLNNIYILYFIFIIAVGNLFYLLIENNVVFVTVFILIGFLTSFFSKNMIVILTTTMVFTNILKCGISIRNTEGFDDSEKKDEPDEKKDDGKDGMVPEIDKDLDNHKLDKEEKIMGTAGKGKKKSNSDDSTNENKIIMDLASLDDKNLNKINDNLDKQKDILNNLNSMKPIIKSLDSFTKMISPSNTSDSSDN
jgi:hypothetical protein